MRDYPQLTHGQLRALRIAGRQTHRTPHNERVENHLEGRQYILELRDMGLLHRTSGREGDTIDVTPFAVEVLDAYWNGVMSVRAGVMCEQGE